MAEKPDHETPVGSYPDNPRPGTTKRKKTGGAKNICGNRRAKSLSATPTRVVRVDTIPMTAEEFDNAIEAWAVLLNRYWQDHPEDAT
ncbi:hypothetical protein GCM10022251_79620 [Phytohabitans flavus]|uniref:Uncharacterized protein n=1 Tax=Phytohabitans flavus TaxID=1076124 RepID=A0A6F8Y467_9ACTN|nr:hypothetical protein Pflav_073160 [Phytohabitans flavus]